MASSLFKVTVVQHWLYDCWIDGEGQPCDKAAPGARFVKSRKVKPGTPGARKVKKKSGKWYGRLPGSTKPIPLSANKVAAQQMLAAMVRKSELGKVGLNDPYEDHRKRPLTEHLDEWEADLRASGATAKHVNQTVACARRVIDGCKFAFMADLSPSRVQQFVAGLRELSRPSLTLDPAKESYTKAELAGLLGVKGAGIPALIRKGRLEAKGNGKARRYPKATAETLLASHAKGRSIKTSNLYLAAVKQFAAWLVQDRRIADSPLAHLAGGNVKLDRRHDRRALTPEEVRSVIQAAQQSALSFRGLTGPDRAALYSLACASGFRASELASLSPGAFDLDAKPPTVTLAAEHAKNGTTAVQPLPADAAEALREYLADRPAGAPVWPGTWTKKAAEMFSHDLKAAGIPYVVDGPDGPLYADFHALRHSFIALLDKAGATLKEAMQLARHSDPKLTMAVYGRARLHDLGKAVGRLPSLTVGGTSKPGAMKATGTDPLPVSVCTGFVQTNDTERSRVRPSETQGERKGGKDTGRNHLPSQGVAADCDLMRPPETSSPVVTHFELSRATFSRATLRATFRASY